MGSPSITTAIPPRLYYGDNMNVNKDLIYDIYGKVTGKIDIEWSEICLKHNLDCHPDTLRKAGVGIKMAADAGVVDFNTSTNETYDALFKAKKQFYDQRREYNKLLTEETRWDHVYDELVKAAKKVGSLVPLSCTPIRSKDYFSQNEAVLVLCDWHYGLTTDNVWNVFNKDVAYARINKLKRDVKEKLADQKVKTLHVALLGDMISGGIHNSIRVKNNEDVVEQLMEVSEYIAQLIDDLSEEVYNVKVYSTWGNHARLQPSLKDSIHSDNLERIIPFWLKQRFSGRNTSGQGGVSVIETDSHELMRIIVCGHEVCGVHGDLDVPSTNPMLTMSLLYEKCFNAKLEILITGHFHHIETKESYGVTWIGCSSLCGTDDYAKDKRLFSSPSQTLLIFDKEGLDSIHNIDLSNVEVVTSA